MNIQDILKIDITDKNVLIIGCPASGKTWLAKEIFEPNGHLHHIIYHTDNFIEFKTNESIFAAINLFDKHTIIEGVLGYRLLLEGVKTNTYFPDIVIELKITHKKMLEIYATERKEKKAKYLKDFNAKHQAILNEYFDVCPKELKPEWITVWNEY